MPEQQLWILLVIFVAYLCRAAFGFGNGLIAMPLLAMLIPVSEASPLVAFVSVVSAAALMKLDGESLQWRAAIGLTATGLLGIPVGFWLSQVIDERVAKIFLGVLVTAFAIWNLWRPTRQLFFNDRYATAFGAIAGILAGAYNCPGPPLAVYCQFRGLTNAAFRSTIQSFFFFIGIGVCIVRAVSGSFTPNVVWLCAYSLPVLCVSIWIGRRLARSISPARFQAVIWGLLICVGVMLLWTSLRAS